MSRRKRALGFLLLAVGAAAVAVTVADRYRARVAGGYGPLRPTVVLAAELDAGRRIGPREVGSLLTVRRVPARFVPPDALALPGEALGLVTRAPLPAGTYLLGSQLELARRGKASPGRLAGGRRPVEILVHGASSLLAAGALPPGSKVDVVVTSEPDGAGPGRTHVGAAGVPLVDLRPGPEGSGPGAGMAATLGLTRRQALRLIAAESFARKLTLLPVG